MSTDPNDPERAPAEGAGDADAPAERPSAMQLLSSPVQYPDDSALAKLLRGIDRRVGLAEQIALVGLLVVIVGTGVLQTLSTKLFKHSFAWSFDTVRAGTFAIAMLAAAYASHQASHLSMDLVSRKLPPRARQAMRLAMGVFTLLATALFLYSGSRLTSQLWTEAGSHVIHPGLVALMIPVGCALLMFHTTLHLAIDVDYMVRGKRLPEKAPSAH